MIKSITRILLIIVSTVSAAFAGDILCASKRHYKADQVTPDSKKCLFGLISLKQKNHFYLDISTILRPPNPHYISNAFGKKKLLTSKFTISLRDILNTDFLLNNGLNMLT